MKKLIFLIVLSLLMTGISAQVSIAPGGSVSQDFSIGTSAAATLPTGWRVDKSTSVRTVGTYSAAGTVTEQRAGNNMSSSAANGIYNYGAGDPTTATDRAIGWVASSSATKNGNLYVHLNNNGGSTIQNFTISYDVEKYRMGTNPDGFSVQMYYSTDGTSWTSAGSNFLTSFAADATTAGYTPAPGVTVSVTSQTLNVSVGASSNLYLAWNWSVTSGTTTSSAQALGIDNVTIVANSGGSPTPTISVNPSTLTGFTYVLGNGPSEEQTFTISGADLTGNVTVTAPANYQISKISGSDYASPLTFTPADLATPKTVYVRLVANLSVGTYNNEIITASGGGATDKTVTCSGSVTAPPPPNAPVATDATNITSSSFSANWGAVSGATSYRLDVYTEPTRTELINMDFEGYTNDTPPPGWTRSSSGSYFQNISANAYSGTHYAGTNATNGWVQTPQITNPGTLTYWAKASGTTSNYTIKVQSSTNGSDWTDQQTIVADGSNTGSVTTTYTQKTVNLNLVGDFYLRWFMSARTGGSLYFDDVVVTGGSTSYVEGYEDLNVGNVVTYPVSGLNPGTTYYYVVRSVNEYGTSANSAPIQAVTAEGTSAPAVPVAIAATEIGVNSFIANWDASSGATSYRLDVSTVNTFASFVAGYNNLTVNGTNQTVSGLAANTPYYYRVRAYNVYGTSDNSNTITATTLASDPFGGYYNPVAGLSGSALKSGLRDLLPTNTNTNYDGAKLVLFQDMDNVGGVVKCVYTGETWTVNSSYNGSTNPNTEHTYAQSWFDGTASESVKKADLHHLFITNSSVNSSRSNYPFDEVTNVSATFSVDPQYVSKRGTNADGRTVWEPADPHKGNLARAMLYFHVRYDMPLSWNGVDMLETMLDWNTADPVDADELARNAEAYTYQGNRNFFIDKPQYITSIWGGAPANTVVQFNPASAMVNEGDGTVSLSVEILNPSTTNATTAQVILASGNAGDIGNYTTTNLTFPANTGTSQQVVVTITDDALLEGTETFIFSITNVSGGDNATVGFYGSFNLSIEDNDIPVPVATDATLPTMDGFTANWDATQGITDFEFDLSTSNTFATFVPGYEALLVTGTSLAISGLNGGSTYYYRLRALYNESAGANSNVITANTEAPNYYVELNALAPITENFDYLTNGTWTNGVTAPGWYAKTDATATIPTYAANTGTTTTGALYAFGVEGTNPLSDRALGLISSNQFTGASGTGKGYIGWRLKNNTGSTVNSLTVTWTGEQWRKENNAAAHTLNLFYQTGETVTDPTAGTWTSASSVFTTPIIGATTATALDGNAPANRVVDIEATLSGLNLADGQEIMLRWEDLNDAGSDHAMAIDDLSVEIGSATLPPAVTVSTEALTGFTYVAGSGPSAEQSFTVSGSNLEAGITVTPPTNYEISLVSGAGFTPTNPIILSPSRNSVGETPIYVRLKASLAAGDYNGETISIASSGVADQFVTCSGSVTEPVVGTLLLEENFEYTAETYLTDNGWTAHSGGTTNAITVVSPGLSYPAYLSVSGNAASLTTNGQDVNRTFTNNDAETIYASFLVNISSVQTGDYFFHYGPDPIGSSFRGRVYVQANGDDLNFGITKTNETPVLYSDVNYAKNVTHLLVLKYQTVEGADNDPVSLWVNPDISGAEPAPLLNKVGAGDITVKSVALRQGGTSSAPVLKLDGIRVATSWSALFPTAPVIAVSETSLTGMNYYLDEGPSAETSFTVSGSNLEGDITITPPANYQISTASGASFVPTNPITLSPTEGSVASTTIYVRLKAILAVGAYNNEQIVISSTGVAPNKIVLCNGEVFEPRPTLFVDPSSLTGLSYALGSGPSAAQYFTLSGLYLGGPVTLSQAENPEFEISLSSDAGFRDLLEIEPNDGTMEPTQIFVRMKAGFASGSYSGEISITADEADEKIVTCSGDVYLPAARLFFSEYIEGTSNNKALEIFNPEDDEVDLSDYRIELYSNGSATINYNLVPNAILASNEVFVIANDAENVAPAIQNVSDVTSSVTFFNGNDAVALRYLPSNQIIDVIGLIGNDPGTAWPVAGTANATIDHTLIRKPTVTQGNTDWAASAGTNAENSEWIVQAVDTFADLGSHTYTPGLDYVANPVFDPAAGTYFTTQNVTITTATENATVYYKTSAEAPWTVYTVALPVSQTTTIWAYAAKAGMEDSFVVSATYTFPINVQNIAELRQGTINGPLYRLTGEAVLTFQQATRNQKYIQDATGAIVIDDQPGTITTSYNLYDGITGITGSLTAYANLLQFVPAVNTAPATSTGNVVVPEVRTLESLTSADQAKLIKVLNVTIDSSSGNFPSTAQNLNVTQGETVRILRTFPATNYSGTPIPVDAIDMICLVGQFNADMQVSPRFLSDFLAIGGDLDTPELSIAMVGEQIQLSWTAVDGAVSYQVLHCDTPDGEFTQAAVVNAPTTTWNIPSVVTKKFYQVIARDF